MTSEICLWCIIQHPEHNKIKIDMAESEEAFEGVFEFSVQVTSKDFSQNSKPRYYESRDYDSLLSLSKLIVLKPEQEAAIRD